MRFAGNTEYNIKMTHKIKLAFVFAFVLFLFSLPTEASTAIQDGDLLSAPNNPDVYIIKIIGDKRFKRHILNPDIFESYGHLSWESIKERPQEVLDTFTTSDLVIEVNEDGFVADPRIYRVSAAPGSDVGERRHLDLTSAEFEYMGFDWDAIYHVNHTEASPDFYPEREHVVFDRTTSSREHFTVFRNESIEKTLEKLRLDGYINNEEDFRSRVSGSIASGGYLLSGGMSEDEIASVLNSEPAMIWLTVREGYRKEQIGNFLARNLGWSDVRRDVWMTAHKRLHFDLEKDPDDYYEGVYFPDTYLFPRNEGPVQAASRMINNFKKRTAGYAEAFEAEHGISWQDALTLASMVQREASGAEDAPLVAGILWNRIEEDMAFQLDATIQYAINTAEGGWWSSISSSDRGVDSPFNTYMYKGIPPHPISNPGMVYIDAILNPESTDCIFFIHARGQIYCSATYQGHLDNINRYLR